MRVSAVQMIRPRLYGPFHIIMAVIGIGLSVILAYRLRDIGYKRLLRLLFYCGLILIISEVYKQFFLYYAVNDGVYEWDKFPFQLCSVPMYLMVLLPVVPDRVRKYFLAFLPAFAFMGGVMVYIDPADMLSRYAFLTFHSFIWHFILIFCGLVTAFNTERIPFKYPFTVYIIGCVIAEVFNFAFNGFGYISMFYINPKRPMTQIVFSKISGVLGTWPGIAVYVAAMALGGYVFYRLAYFLRGRVKKATT